MEKNKYIIVLYANNKKDISVIKLSNNLKDMEKMIGNKLDMIEKGEVIIIYDKTKNKLKEGSIDVDKILGSFLIVGNDKHNSDFISLTNDQIKKYKRILRKSREKQEEEEVECE